MGLRKITKDYESHFNSMKDQCKIIFTLNFRPYILILQYRPRVSCVYNIIAVFKLSCKISHL